MNKRITFFALVLFFSLSFVSKLLCQVDTLWTKTIGGNGSEEGYSVLQTTDGGYIITGYTDSYGAGDRDVWLIKTDASGDILWTKTFGGSDADRANSLLYTTDGGYIIIGATRSFGAGNYDVWLIKTDAFGDTLWTKTFGGIDADMAHSIQKTIDGGYIIIGATRSFGDGNYDVWLIKTDAFGDTLWTKTFGGIDLDVGFSVQQTSDGGYILCGETASYGAGSVDIWLIKTDNSGDTLWTKTFGGSSIEWSHSVQQTSDSGYIITGTTGSFGAGNDDVWLIKTNTSGDTLWTKTFGGVSGDWSFSVQQTSDRGYVLCGETASYGAGNFNVWLIKTNTFGDTLWTKTFGGSDSDVGYSFQQTADAGYIIIGTTFSPVTLEDDFLLIKTTPDITDVRQNTGIIISDYFLHQNFPNPFNPSTKISWQVPVGSWQTLNIYDVLGNEVATLVDEYKPAGTYEVEWNASNYPSGVYFYQLKSENFVETKKMILIK